MQDESRTRRVEKRRKYSKTDKGAKNKLAGSPGENGGEQDAQKDLHSSWKGRDKEKDPGKDGEKKQKKIFKWWE